MDRSLLNAWVVLAITATVLGVGGLAAGGKSEGSTSEDAAGGATEDEVLARAERD